MAEPRDDTRSRILDAAVRLFASQGFAATSTRELSEQLGFTKAALYYHFRTKDDVLLALAEPVMRDLDAMLEGYVGADRTTSISTRRRLLTDYLDVLLRHRARLRVMLSDLSALAHPVIGRHAREVSEQLETALVGLEATLSDRVRAVSAVAALQSCVLTLVDVPAEELRGPALHAALTTLGIRPARSRPLGSGPLAEALPVPR